MTSINAKHNREIVERLFETFRAGNTEAFDALIVDDHVHSTTRKGATASPPPRPSSRS